MTQRNSATSNVQLSRINIQDFGAVNCHGSKGLVDFDDVNIRFKVEVEF